MKSLILAIILVESAFNPKAHNRQTNARGLMQLIPIGVKEASIQCGLPPSTNLFSGSQNVLYGKCLLSHYLEVADGSIPGALALYNGGYRAYKQVQTGVNTNYETANYIAKVMHFKELIDAGILDLSVYCFSAGLGKACKLPKPKKTFTLAVRPLCED